MAITETAAKGEDNLEVQAPPGAERGMAKAAPGRTDKAVVAGLAGAVSCLRELQTPLARAWPTAASRRPT
jgi:hypothetical protein